MIDLRPQAESFSILASYRVQKRVNHGMLAEENNNLKRRKLNVEVPSRKVENPPQLDAVLFLPQQSETPKDHRSKEPMFEFEHLAKVVEEKRRAQNFSMAPRPQSEFSPHQQSNIFTNLMNKTINDSPTSKATGSIVIQPLKNTSGNLPEPNGVSTKMYLNEPLRKVRPEFAAVNNEINNLLEQNS